MTKAAMKEVLTELFSEVPGLKELMEKPPTTSLDCRETSKRLYTSLSIQLTCMEQSRAGAVASE